VIVMKHGRSVILVTGASGFVGRNLAPMMAARGFIVRPAVRKPSLDANAVIVPAIGPQTDWTEALVDVDVVVHLAARVPRPREDYAIDIYRSLNTDGTLQLARCAAKAAVRQFIYLSTVLVNGSSTDGRAPFREDDRLTPRGVYGMSKAAAETGLEKIANATDMAITVIRPPLIYGVGALGNFRLLVAAVKRGIPLPFGSICNRRAFLGVENLASFVAHRLSHPGDKFEVFLLADEKEVSTPEFIRRIGEALGKKARIIPLPLLVLKGLFRFIGRPEASNSVIGSLEIDTSKALNTGWRPPLSLDEGLRRSLQRTEVGLVRARVP
jgi:UDP-glucose 4-epimerase